MVIEGPVDLSERVLSRVLEQDEARRVLQPQLARTGVVRRRAELEFMRGHASDVISYARVMRHGHWGTACGLAMGLAACPGPGPEANAPLPDDLRISPLGRGDAGPLVDPDDATHPATREECIAVVDANITVQLRAMGFEDPALLERRKKELQAQLSKEIESCIGKKTSTRAIECAMAARSAGEIDRCFR